MDSLLDFGNTFGIVGILALAIAGLVFVILKIMGMLQQYTQKKKLEEGGPKEREMIEELKIQSAKTIEILRRVETTVDSLQLLLRGNGDIGLVTKVILLTEQVARLEKELNELKEKEEND